MCSFWLLNYILKIPRYVRTQFMKGVVKHWTLDPLFLGAYARLHAYQVRIVTLN